MKLNLSRIESPLGQLLLVTDLQERLRALDFANYESHLRRNLREHYGQSELARWRRTSARLPERQIEALKSQPWCAW